MPPNLEHPPVPLDDGKSAADYLAAHGLVGQTPTIRASDFELALHDPFRYYLTRRLGLAPRLSWSKALNRGSWIHKAFQLDDWTAPDREAYLACVRDRILELREIAPFAGLAPAALEQWVLREAHDADACWAWYQVHRTIAPRAPDHPAFPALFAQGTTISKEIRLTAKMDIPGGKSLIRAIQPDLLWVDRTGGLWIVDLKTCGESPQVRLSSCPIEFQARHYAYVLAWLQDNNPDALPAAARGVDIAGVMHIALQKPTIELCDKDRNFTEAPRTITRGARKGVTVMERTYEGEPRWENYLVRSQEWLTGTGSYADEAKAREADPTVNYSRVTAPLLFSRQARKDYERDLSYLVSLATLPAFPENFPKSARGVVDFKKPTKWAPFYLNPVVDWPGIVEAQSLMTTFRDEDLMETPDA